MHVVLPATDRSDTELAQRVRDGDRDAYGELWRRHAEAGRAVARRITDRFDPDDLVAEAFARILEALGSGRGPDGAFRPYLYATLRNVAMSWTARAGSTTSLDGVDGPVDEPPVAQQIADEALLARAYASLPPEWAEVLWYTELEELTPAEVAPLIGLQPNAAAALAYRAREGLRRAWLQAHVTRLPDRADCRWVAERVGDHHRGALSPRARRRFDQHLETCDDCPVLVAEVGTEAEILVRARLRALLWPALTAAVAGPAAPAALGAAGGGPSGAGPRGTRRLRPARRSLTAAAAAAAVVLALAAGAFALAGLRGAGDGPRPQASDREAPAAPAAPAAPGAEAADPVDGPVDPEPDDAEPLPPAEGTAPPRGPAGEGTPAGTRAAPVADRGPADAPPAPPAPSGPATPVEPETPVDEGPAAPVVLDVLDDPHHLPALSGTAVPGAAVELRAPDGTVLGATTADTSGAWRAAVLADVDAGTAVTLVVVQSVDGVESPVAGPFGPYTPAAPTLLSPTDGEVVEPVALDGDGIADDLQVRFDGTTGLRVEAAVDGMRTGRTHVLEDAPLVRTVHGLTPGEHTFAVRYADPDRGLVGAWTRVTFTVP